MEKETSENERGRRLRTLVIACTCLVAVAVAARYLLAPPGRVPPDPGLGYYSGPFESKGHPGTYYDEEGRQVAVPAAGSTRGGPGTKPGGTAGRSSRP